MAEALLVSTLERHCIELDKRLEEYRCLKSQAESDLVHLRSTIAFIERSDGAGGAKIPIKSMARIFDRGEVFALCREALLKDGPELTTRDLAEVCMRAKNLDPAEVIQRRAIMQHLIEILSFRRATGEIEKAGIRGRVSVWRLPLRAAN